VTSNAGAAPDYSDYDLVFNGDQDWRYNNSLNEKFETLHLTYVLTSTVPTTPPTTPPSSVVSMKVFLQANGQYYDLGLRPNTSTPTTVAIPLSSAVPPIPPENLERVTAIKFRVKEEWFQGDTVSGRRAYVTIKDIKISGNMHLRPRMTFWPLPALDTLPIPQSDKNQAYWWTYDWYEGGVRNAALPGTSYYCKGKGGISATYLNDGAFLDNTTNTADLIAISFFKTMRCLYWRPGIDQILRWYAQGFVTAPTPLFGKSGIGNAASQFLTFRGDSRWYSDPPGNPLGPSTVFTNSATTPDVTEVITDNAYIGSPGFWNGFKYTSTGGDNNQFANYTVLPERMVDVDLIMSPDATLRQPRDSTGTPIITDTALLCGLATIGTISAMT
jgi:hypothetical protein